ncbi:MAG: hypothetical protein HFH74_13640 [Lachnospiraceae bacterium]|jgi:hypothetical protein|nr:hypothetical protein [Lachnospiraceae bacterium]
MQEKIEERHKEITHIQNTIWAMYKDFLADHDMAAYNRKIEELSKEYTHKGNQQLLSFCQNILISWCPIINGLAEEFRKEER